MLLFTPPALFLRLCCLLTASAPACAPAARDLIECVMRDRGDEVEIEIEIEVEVEIEIGIGTEIL